MSHNTARTVYRRSVRALAITAPAAVTTMITWAGGLLPQERGSLVMMVYLMLLSASITAAVVAAAAACQVGVGRAFQAGLRAGQEMVQPPAPKPPSRPVLRVVRSR